MKEKRESTKSRMKRRTGPRSRAGRYFSSPVFIAWRILRDVSPRAARWAAAWVDPCRPPSGRWWGSPARSWYDGTRVLPSHGYERNGWTDRDGVTSLSSRPAGRGVAGCPTSALGLVLG